MFYCNAKHSDISHGSSHVPCCLFVLSLLITIPFLCACFDTVSSHATLSAPLPVYSFFLLSSHCKDWLPYPGSTDWCLEIYYSFFVCQDFTQAEFDPTLETCELCFGCLWLETMYWWLAKVSGQTSVILMFFTCFFVGIGHKVKLVFHSTKRIDLVSLRVRLVSSVKHF